jgi:hypothetical protein
MPVTLAAQPVGEIGIVPPWCFGALCFVVDRTAIAVAVGVACTVGLVGLELRNCIALRLLPGGPGYVEG